METIFQSIPIHIEPQSNDSLNAPIHHDQTTAMKHKTASIRPAFHRQAENLSGPFDDGVRQERAAVLEPNAFNETCLVYTWMIE